MNKLQTYTIKTPCTIIGDKGPECPFGWKSVGYTQPGSCLIGNVPGLGHTDQWKMNGYNRVCKKDVLTSGDLAVDCCSDLFGISNSLECQARGYKPYSWQCNNVMEKKCNTLVQPYPFGPEWNGMPYGRKEPIYDGCTGKLIIPTKERKAGCIDEFCINYLRKAPPNNFFHNHDYQDYPHSNPRHSYNTPAFSGTWGYQPMRTPYKPYNDWNNKISNNYCKQFPAECLNNYNSTNNW